MIFAENYLKWNARKAVKAPVAFTNAYPDASFHVITHANIEDYLLSDSL